MAIIGAFSDMMRHLRKSIHCSMDDSNLGAEVIEWNRKYQTAVDECLVQLSRKVAPCSFLLFSSQMNAQRFGLLKTCFNASIVHAFETQVGDAGPVLDVMAVMLENISNITVMARTMVSAVYRTAQIIASIPNLLYQNKASLDLLLSVIF